MTSIRGTFGHAPVSFRSPAWCPLGRGAVELLVALGYRIDSSTTPQHLPIFSSTPYGTRGSLATRPAQAGSWSAGSPYFLFPAAGRLADLLDAASPGHVRLPAPAALEARRSADRVPCVQLHVSDFVPDSAPLSPEETLGLGSFLPRRDGGLRFKVFLRERDPGRVYAITRRSSRRSALIPKPDS